MTITLLTPHSMVIQWSEEDQLYLVHLPEFPWRMFHTHGKTYEEAARNGQAVIEMLVGYLQQEGKPLPEPHVAKGVASGNGLSLPKSVMTKVSGLQPPALTRLQLS